jgi:hypothetical protein
MTHGYAWATVVRCVGNWVSHGSDEVNEEVVMVTQVVDETDSGDEAVWSDVAVEVGTDKYVFLT